MLFYCRGMCVCREIKFSFFSFFIYIKSFKLKANSNLNPGSSSFLCRNTRSSPINHISIWNRFIQILSRTEKLKFKSVRNLSQSWLQKRESTVYYVTQPVAKDIKSVLSLAVRDRLLLSLDRFFNIMQIEVRRRNQTLSPPASRLFICI